MGVGVTGVAPVGNSQNPSWACWRAVPRARPGGAMPLTRLLALLKDPVGDDQELDEISQEQRHATVLEHYRECLRGQLDLTGGACALP